MAAPKVSGIASDDQRASRASYRNRQLAYQAIRHVREHFPLYDLNHPEPRDVHVTADRFGQWMLGRFEQVWRVAHEGERQGAPIARTTNALVHRLVRAAERSRTGEAGAQAAIAYGYLHSLGYRPLDFMHSPGRERAFVVLGRKLHEGTLGAGAMGPKALGLEAWGNEAVICDPFRGLAFRMPELVNTEYYHDYYPCESQLRAELVAGGAEP